MEVYHVTIPNCPNRIISLCVRTHYPHPEDANRRSRSLRNKASSKLSPKNQGKSMKLIIPTGLIPLIDPSKGKKK
jgi:hypothetical protein